MGNNKKNIPIPNRAPFDGETSSKDGEMLKDEKTKQHLAVTAKSDGRDLHNTISQGRHVPHILSVKDPEENKLSMAWSFECDGKSIHNGGVKLTVKVYVTELFSSKVSDCQATIREGKADEMVNFLRTSEGQVVNVGDIVFTTLFNMLGNVLLSKDFIKFDSNCETKALLRKMLEMAMVPNLADFFWVFSRFDVQNLKVKFADLLKKFFLVWKHIVDERRERKDDSKDPRSRNLDFLDVMIDNGFGDDQINQLLSELFGAGTDTTTSTIEWAMTELIRNPESLKKVRDELAEELIDTSKTIQEPNMQKLHYLQACIKETLRLHPPAPFLIPHRAIESCKLMNYTIPKNSQILINVWAIGRDSSIWEDPLSFKPERFLCSNLDFKGHDFNFIPFGSGRKLCPGLPMAAKVVPLILGSLISNFDWSLPNGAEAREIDMNEKFGVTLQKESPLLLVPRMRI